MPSCTACRERAAVAELCRECMAQIGRSTSPWLPLERSRVIVAGLGRCGSSLVMQMLDAGGLPVLGSYPDYEPAIVKEVNERPAAWLEATAGRAVKALDPHRWRPPPGDHRVIWLTRDVKQQARSGLKLLGGRTDREARRRMTAGLTVDYRHGFRAAAVLTPFPVLELSFETLIRNPRRAAGTLSFMLGGLDVERMVKQVRPRPSGSDCLGYLLEPILAERTEVL